VAETRIAIVDDDLAVRELLDVMLSDAGYSPVQLPPGPNLLARLGEVRPAVIVLDWRVGGEEGSAFDGVRADPRLATIPILICTGDLDAMRRHAPRLATLPNVAIVEKPFQVDVLLAVLERMATTGRARSAPGRAPEPGSPLAEAVRRRGAAAQARAVLEVFRSAADWVCTELWLPDRGLLRCVTVVADTRRRGFADHSRRTSLVPGFGLPGRVVSGGRPAWIPDVLVDANFPRAPAARRFGVRAAAGAPVTAGDTVIGVVCGYAPRPLPRDDELLEGMSGLASSLGAWLDDARGSLLRPDAVSVAARQLAQEATGHADVVAVDLLDPDGSLQRAAVAHADPAMAEVALRLEAFTPREEGPVAVAVRTLTPQRTAVSDATLRRWSASPEHLLVLRALQLHSMVAVPLVQGDLVLGGVTLSSPDPRWHASSAATEAIGSVPASSAADELGRLVLGRRSRR
jgi:GAF domain-containing protein